MRYVRLEYIETFLADRFDTEHALRELSEHRLQEVNFLVLCRQLPRERLNVNLKGGVIAGRLETAVLYVCVDLRLGSDKLAALIPMLTPVSPALCKVALKLVPPNLAAFFAVWAWHGGITTGHFVEC